MEQLGEYGTRHGIADEKIIKDKNDRKMRNEAILAMKNKGLSIRQIERLTGINKGVIQRVKCVK